METDDIRRAQGHAALGDATRLAIAEDLWFSDRAPSEIGRLLEVPSNLLAHHLATLEDAGLIERTASRADGRRRYVRLRRAAFCRVAPAPGPIAGGPALFLCTHNSARSQLAAAVWRRDVGPAESAGTEPGRAVHPGALRAARRAGLDLSGQTPRALAAGPTPAVVVTVCDRAHESLAVPANRWHWSIADPAADPRPEAFDAALAELIARIHSVARAAPTDHEKGMT